MSNDFPEFQDFPKMARLSREVIITEKLDGTNAQVFITDDGRIFAGSRTRWITPQNDNYGFAKWVESNKEKLLTLPPGRHFGEWWGNGIQRGYNVPEKRFSLFNVSRFVLAGQEPGDGQYLLPDCVGLVPVLYRGVFDTNSVNDCLWKLAQYGSMASPGFMRPEGVVIYHIAGGVGFKKTLEKDELPKTLAK